MLPVDYRHPQRTTIGFTRPIGADEPGPEAMYGTPFPLLRWALTHLELGDYVCFLDDDNEYQPTYLETMLTALSDSAVGIAICPLEDLRDSAPHQGYPQDGHCDTNGFLARTSAAKDVGMPYLGPEEMPVQDVLFIKLCANRHGWIRVPHKLVRYGVYPATEPPMGRTAGWASAGPGSS
jgi:hypothetical protein